MPGCLILLVECLLTKTYMPANYIYFLGFTALHINFSKVNLAHKLLGYHLLKINLNSDLKHLLDKDTNVMD